MKAVILAGGFGTRISEETDTKPKPMVEIGGMPILWHIMKIYSAHGINDFVICCGYKGYYIKEYFSNYFLHNSDVTFCMKTNEMRVHRERAEPWTVTLVDTGPATLTGGRLKRVAEHLKSEEAFFFTYGDGVADVDIAASLAFHQQHQSLGTMTTAYPPGRFGAVDIRNNQVKSFNEKPKGDGGMVNAGFFVLSPKVLDWIDSDDTSWEDAVLPKLAEAGELMAFEHRNFWQPMDTLRDKNHLEKLWTSGAAPWKKW
tara:strand:+ start:150 stop:920 length:771 start_codon:yes stop_codon:yes gene_type:complete